MKSLFKKWWVWVIVVLVLITIITGGNNDNETDVPQNTTAPATINTEDKKPEQKTESTPEPTQAQSPDTTTPSSTPTIEPTSTPVPREVVDANLFEGYKLIEVDGGDLSGYREPNVVVDIGFGDRQYWAFTNEYGQLVKVIAKEIIPQDESTEPVTSDGRYYHDEAKVPGTERPDLDEGHVIADSLGGVSNAYNITPQNSTLNRHGDQAYMEKVIRDAGGCTDFVAIITYPNTETQIPSHYSYTYTLKGNVIHDEFDNVDPDEVNACLEENISTTTPEPLENSAAKVIISNLDKQAEYVEITNQSEKDIDMTGWYIISVLGEQRYDFPTGYILNTGASIKVGGFGATVDLVWEEGRGVWNNSKDDDAELYNNQGELVSRLDD